MPNLPLRIMKFTFQLTEIRYAYTFFCYKKYTTKVRLINFDFLNETLQILFRF